MFADLETIYIFKKSKGKKIFKQSPWKVSTNRKQSIIWEQGFNQIFRNTIIADTFLWIPKPGSKENVWPEAKLKKKILLGFP